MTAALCLFALFGALVAGYRYPGALIAGTFFTYQAGSLSSHEWVGTVYVVLAASVAMVRYLKAPHRISLGMADSGLLLLTLYLCLSAFWSPDPDDTVHMSVLLVQSVLGMYVIARLESAPLSKLISQMNVTAAAVGAVMAYGMLTERAVGMSYAENHRLILLNQDASAVGLSQALPISMFASVAFLFFTYSNWKRLLALGSLALVGYVSIVSATRSVFLSLIVASLLALAMGAKSIPLRRYLVGGCAAICAIAVLISVLPGDQMQTSLTRLLGNFTSGGVQIDNSSLDRLYLFRAAQDLIVAHPFIGTSYGVFGRYSFFDYPHNLFLEIGSAGGIVGLALLMTWLGYLVIGILKIRKQDTISAAVLFGYISVSFVQMQVSFPFFVARPLFLMTAIVAAYQGMRRIPRPRQDTQVHPIRLARAHS